MLPTSARLPPARSRARGQRPPAPFRYSVAAAGTLTAAASAIGGAAACPPCALADAGRLLAAFVRPTAFRGVTASVDFLTALLLAARLRPGLAAADFAAGTGVAFFGVATFPAALALAFLSAAHRFFVAAMIRARPSGVRRRFFLAVFAGAGVAAAAALATVGWKHPKYAILPWSSEFPFGMSYHSAYWSGETRK